MSVEQNKQLTRRWFEEVWNQKRSRTIDELIASDAVVHGLSQNGAESGSGPTAFRPFWERFCGAFPDARIVVEDMIAEGEKIAARITFRGTHSGIHLGAQATGKPVSASGIVLTRWENGKIAEAWNEFDALTVFLTAGVVKMA